MKLIISYNIKARPVRSRSFLVAECLIVRRFSDDEGLYAFELGSGNCDSASVTLVTRKVILYDMNNLILI